ncbi:MAG: peptidoglycan DD-metalloendopeptidase family protein, partial [Paludibacteraceae bacterium]|nr:peptidoglycan DD-metalloendopeptidase family protein [Paludibacteraceae bacterium]
MKQRIFLLFFIVLMPFVVLLGQTRKDLEKQRKKVQNNINYTAKLLNETNKSTRTSTNKINLFQQYIKQRIQLIQIVGKELEELNLFLDTLQNRKTKLGEELQILKNNYVRLVQQTHFHYNAVNSFMFVFSAENFNQLFRRFRYLQEFSAYRKQQIKEIENKQAESQKVEENNFANINKKNDFIKIKREETVRLEYDKSRENKNLEALKRDKKKWENKLKEQKRLAAELDKKIQKIIDREIKKRTKTTTDSKGKVVEKIELTKEETLLAGNFEKNKGRLPWPVEKGFVTKKFGVQKHPTLPHIEYNIKGIFIQTTANSNARAVFDGVVSSVIVIPGKNTAVIVQHGNYFTLYQNLQTVYVKQGQKVTAKQAIGKIYTDPEDD